MPDPRPSILRAPMLALMLALGLCLCLPLPLSAQTVVDDAAHEQYVFAKRLFDAGEWAHAADAFDQYLKDYPRDEKFGDALYHRALLSSRAGDPKLAAELLRKVRDTTQVKRGAVDALHGHVLIEQDQHREALKVLEAIRADDLPEALVLWVHHLRGQAYRGTGNLDAAIRHLTLASAKASAGQAAALFELAQVQRASDLHDQALTTAQKVIELNDPTLSPAAARFAADLHAREGQHNDALRVLRLIIENHQRSPQFSPAVVDMLRTLYRLGRYDDLLQQANRLQKDLQRDDRIHAAYYMGLAHQKTSRHVEALEFFLTIRRNTPGWVDEPNLLFRIAESQLALRQYEAVDRTLEQLARSHPDAPIQPQAQLLAIDALIAQNKHDDAVTALTRILRAGEKQTIYVDALLKRAWLYDRLNQPQPAAADYVRYIELAPKQSDQPRERIQRATLRLIDLQLAAGDHQSAQQLTRALIRDDQLPAELAQEALYRDALALVRLGQHEQALKQFDTLLKDHPRTPHVSSIRYWRGLLRMSAGQVDDALADLVEAGTAQDMDTRLRINALRLVATTQRQRERDEQAAKALDALMDLVDLDQVTVEELLWLAQYHIDRAEDAAGYDRAGTYLAPLVGRTRRVSAQTRAAAGYLEGIRLRGLGKLDEAGEMFNLVIGLGHGYAVRARLELARTLAQQRRFRDAMDQYTLLLRDPEGAGHPIIVQSLFEAADIYMQLAQVHRQRGNDDEAQQSLWRAEQRLLRIALVYNDPQHSPMPERSLALLGAINERNGNADKAREHYENLASRYEASPWGAYGSAMADAVANRRGIARQKLQQLRDRELDDTLRPLVVAALTRLEQSP